MIVRALYPNSDSTHYVKGNVDIFTGSDVVNIPNRSWHDWLSVSEQVKRFGRGIRADRDYVGVMNGDIRAQNVSIIGTWINGSDTVGFSLSSNTNGSLRVNYLVVLGR